MATNQSGYALHLEDPQGNKVVVMPGDELPAWANITNPYVLGVAPAAEHDVDPDDDAAGPPPKSGKGGGVRAWRAYAAANGVEAEGLDVEEIIAALEEAGVPVE